MIIGRLGRITSELLEDLLVLLGLLVTLALVVDCDFGGELLVKALQPLVTFDFRFEGGRNLLGRGVLPF